MNVFEDLVVELKEENLLEETVIDRLPSKSIAQPPVENGNSTIGHTEQANGLGITPLSLARSNLEFKTATTFIPAPKRENIHEHVSDRMSALELVDNVFGAVENTLGGSKASLFDDLSVKKAFHLFTQATARIDSDEYFEAESELLSKLEAWESTLHSRDDEIPVEAVRRYIDASNPPLSPQALFGLLRFYRNSEFSGFVLGKFDFVVSRLFSKFVDGEKRELLCSRPEIRNHLNQRYADWSSGTYSSVAADDAETESLILGFNDFIREAEGANELSELVSTRFFKRLCELKQSAGELFMTAEVASSAVECNLHISKKIIDLIAAEVKRRDANTIIGKYTGIDNELLSNATGRTIDVSALVRGRPLREVAAESLMPTARTRVAESQPVKAKRSKAKKSPSRDKSKRSVLLGVNRWLLIATILTAIISVGIYVWADYAGGDDGAAASVKSVDLEKPDLKQYIRSAKVSGSMLFGIVTPEYEKLSPDQQKEFLLKLRDLGQTKGYGRVSLINSQGKSVGYASEVRVELNGQ